MLSKKIVNRAVAFALAAMSTVTGAVSLGDLAVQSRPGEPMEATLQIEDLDLSISPLLVRVAPPSSYLRAGIAWPQEVQTLHLERDKSSASVRVRLVSDEPMKFQSFPLLIELNAGGKVSVRNYQIVAMKDRFEVLEGTVAPSPMGELAQKADAAQMKSGMPVAAQTKKAPAVSSAVAQTAPVSEKTVKSAGDVEKAEKVQTAEKMEKAAAGAAAKTGSAAQKAAETAVEKTVEKASAAKQAGKTAVARKHRAPEIVREYVALNGFDATEPFHVQHHMTLWSVAKLYWPSYRGSTLEQLLVGFRNRNPAAFEKGDPDVLLTGSTLVPPSEEDVFAIDAIKAFHEIHGERTAVPLPTQNLIDAQKISNALAGSVADAQDRERSAGKGEKDIARAGRDTLESGKTLMAESAETMDKVTEPAPGKTEAKEAATEGMSAGEQTPGRDDLGDGVTHDDAADAMTGQIAQGKSVEEAKSLAQEAAEAKPLSAEKPAVETPQAEAGKLSAVEALTEAAQKVGNLNEVVAAAEKETAPAEPTAEAMKGAETLSVEAADKARAAQMPSDEEKARAAVAGMKSDMKALEAQDGAEKAADAPGAAADAKAGAGMSDAKRTDPQKTAEPESLSPAWWGAIVLVLIFLAGWFFKTRHREEAPEEDEAKKGVVLQKDVKPSTPAQLKAVEKTVDEAVKNGTTAGAMGVGSMAYSEELQKELAAEGSAAAQTAGGKLSPAAGRHASTQPWLEGDEEMPPVDPEATLSEEELKAQTARTGELISGVSLNLEDGEKDANDAKAAPKPAKPQVIAAVNNKEQALQAALEAKYNLAKSFVTMGALNEALELLEEVRQRGNPELKARAAELAATIPVQPRRK